MRFQLRISLLGLTFKSKEFGENKNILNCDNYLALNR